MKVELSRYRIADIKDNRKLNGVIANGADNLYPNYLTGLYNNSVTHQSIINDIASYVMGMGLKVDSVEGQEKLDKFFPKHILKRILVYKQIHQTVSIETILSKTGDIAEINVLNPDQIRISAIESGSPTEFLYRKSWDKRNDHANYRYSQEFEDIWKTDGYEGLFYWYDSGTFPVYYGRPQYMGGINAVELEASIYMMHNHGAQSGMFPSMIISMESSGDAEQDKIAVKSIKDQMTGVANAGKVGVNLTPPGGSPATFTTPNLTGLDKVYENQYAVSEAGILKAHSIPSPLLIAGLNQRNSGFSSLEEEMKWAKNELYDKIVEPMREQMLDILDPMFKRMGIEEEVYFEEGKLNNTIGDASVDEVEDLASEVNDNLKNLSGRQMQGLERVQRKYNQEKMTYDQAEIMLMDGYGFTQKQVQRWLGIDLEELSEVIALNEQDNYKQLLDENVDLITALGESEEDIISQGFVKADVRKVDYENEQNLDNHLKEHFVKLVSTGRARPSQTSSEDGIKGDMQYKVRYRYAGEISSKSRKFCEDMIKANKLYRKEDIDQMSFSGVNAGFGVRGARNYSIFEWKGGIYCHHFFYRETYIKEGLEGGIDFNSPNAKQLSPSQADRKGLRPKDEPDMVDRRPIDTPSRGRVTFSETNSVWQNLKDWFNGSK